MGPSALPASVKPTRPLATGVTRSRGAAVALAAGTFFALTPACGTRPATQRAIAVGAGALGHGIVHAAYRCPDGADACRESVAIGLVVAAGLGLVAGSMAWLDKSAAEAAPVGAPADPPEEL